jgi:hypothetical protein
MVGILQKIRGAQNREKGAHVCTFLAKFTQSACKLTQKGALPYFPQEITRKRWVFYKKAPQKYKGAQGWTNVHRLPFFWI